MERINIRQILIIVGLLIIGTVFIWIGYNNTTVYLHSRNDIYHHIQYVQRLSDKDTVLFEYCECYTTWYDKDEHYTHKIVDCKDYSCTRYYVMPYGNGYIYDTLNYSMKGGMVDLERVRNEVRQLKEKPLNKTFYD